MSRLRWLRAAHRFYEGDLHRAIAFLDAQDDDDAGEVARRIQSRYVGSKTWEIDDRLVRFAIGSGRITATNDTSPGGRVNALAAGMRFKPRRDRRDAGDDENAARSPGVDATRGRRSPNIHAVGSLERHLNTIEKLRRS